MQTQSIRKCIRQCNYTDSHAYLLLMEFQVNNLEELEKVAASFVAQFPDPAVFILHGEMGAGKTTFIKSICSLLGITDASSPTFSLVNEYLTPNEQKIFHFDLYRIKNMEEALDFGFEEYLDQNAFVFIEWPEKIFPLLDRYTEIKIEVQGTNRKISF